MTVREVLDRAREVEDLVTRGYEAGVQLRRQANGDWVVRTWDDVVEGGRRVNARDLGTLGEEDVDVAMLPPIVRVWDVEEAG